MEKENLTPPKKTTEEMRIIDKGYFAPNEISNGYIEIGLNKARSPMYRVLILSILAGAFIAFAAQGSNAAIHGISDIGLQKTLAGVLFATGLMMVVIAGAELFTGNSLIIISCVSGKTAWSEMFKNWSLVYAGNFIGSMIIVFLISQSGQLNFSNGLLGAFTLKVASGKVALTFTQAFCLGILCNWLVCLAVWMASGAKDIVGKLFAIFFPILLFITSGFEHSVANMYYIPAGILAKANPLYVQLAMEKYGVSAAKVDNLNWLSFITNNLIPVTLGNIVGGAFFVGFFYWMSYQYRTNQKDIRPFRKKNTISAK